MAAETKVTISSTLGVSGATSVEIWCTKLDQSGDKPIVSIPLPRQKAKMDAEETPVTYNIDIGRIKELIAIQGFLGDDTTTSAQEKKNKLLKIIYYGRTITITWGTGSREQIYIGNINKWMITETAGIVGKQKTGYESEKNFAVQLSLMIGEDK